MMELPNSADLTESLKSVGLTKYESLVYIALLRVEGATATEIHEISGVPRASVYPVLDRLIQKNLVIVSHSTPRRFRAISPEEGIDNLLRQIQADADAARQVLQEIYRQRVTADGGMEELIWSIYGEEKIIQRLEELIAHAAGSIRIVSSGQLLQKIVQSVLRNAERGIDIEIISDLPPRRERAPHRCTGQPSRFHSGRRNRRLRIWRAFSSWTGKKPCSSWGRRTSRRLPSILNQRVLSIFSCSTGRLSGDCTQRHDQ
ncbi:MAG TPA: TrmB family transcriptional regulator [Methanoculleus sp.]|nr:TrmB family transcriptional regulator [Methanoculleus sp.]